MMNSLLMLRDSSISSLQMLDEAGYTNIVGIKGGFNKYFRFVPNVARCNPVRSLPEILCTCVMDV